MPDSGEGPPTVRQLMADFRSGDSAAVNRLVELFYPELRKLAASLMKRERLDHTWQPTVLVNELYLQLTKIKALPPPGPDAASERSAFLGLAGFLMKRLLIHHARPLYRRTPNVGPPQELDTPTPDEQDLREVEDLLTRLGQIDPVLPQIVEMRVFERLKREEIAERLGCSLRTVGRQWEFARLWLLEALSPSART
jgi:RNA polymerase sigma factor (TIGR02999 family)